jgi:glycosyltransferase involved in cell wall biosynthesis
MANVQVIGNGIDARYFDPKSARPEPEIASRTGPHFVFTGQMDYPPNEVAALWAAENFLPAMRARHGDAEFHVVGRNPTKRLLEKEGLPGLTIWGEVPDVRPFLAAATCVIAPLQIARGVQNKVLEAMAIARPVMVTPEAATGIDAQDGEHWLLCEADTDAMLKRAEELLSDTDSAFDLGSGARQFVLDHHDWDAMLAPLEALVRGDNREAKDAA